MMIVPCKDCDHRHEACHDTCEPYKAWKQWKTNGWKRRCEEARIHAAIVESAVRRNRRAK
jgi:hypothetical protein